MTRLEALRDYIRDMDVSTLDINDWSTCFAGHACNSVMFQNQGLLLIESSYHPRNKEPIEAKLVPAFNDGGENHEGFDALCHFFGLLKREAVYLFAACSYNPYFLKTEMLTKSLLYAFLERLNNIIQQRKDNYGRAPKS